MIDYNIFYKTELSVTDKWSSEEDWDLFISAYNSSERVQHVFKKARAKSKHWLVFPEYNYGIHEYPHKDSFTFPTTNEADFIIDYLNNVRVFDGLRVCVDLTGFIRPYQMFLTSMLWHHGIKRFDAIYSEPTFYEQREKTKFSSGTGCQVRQVMGLPRKFGSSRCSTEA